MPVPFERFQLIYPPHPAITWKPEEIHALPGFSGQLKYDDWRLLIYFLPDGSIEFYTRHKTRLARYRPPTSMLRTLEQLPLERGRFHVLDGGLLHYKTPRVKDVLVLWDILVLSGRYLLGTTYGERYRILDEILGHPQDPVYLKVPDSDERLRVGLRVSRHIWLAPLLEGDLLQHYRSAIRLPEIEGLVLKDLRAPLRRASKSEENARWQIRARRPRLDYRY